MINNSITKHNLGQYDLCQLSQKMLILCCIKMVKSKATLSMKLPLHTFSLFDSPTYLAYEVKDASLPEDTG